MRDEATGGHPVRPDTQQLADTLRAAYTCRHEDVTHGDRYAGAGYLFGVVHHCATCGIPVPGEDCAICQERDEGCFTCACFGEYCGLCDEDDRWPDE